MSKEPNTNISWWQSVKNYFSSDQGKTVGITSGITFLGIAINYFISRRKD